MQRAYSVAQNDNQRARLGIGGAFWIHTIPLQNDVCSQRTSCSHTNLMKLALSLYAMPQACLFFFGSKRRESKARERASRLSSEVDHLPLVNPE